MGIMQIIDKIGAYVFPKKSPEQLQWEAKLRAEVAEVRRQAIYKETVKQEKIKAQRQIEAKYAPRPQSQVSVNNPNSKSKTQEMMDFVNKY